MGINITNQKQYLTTSCSFACCSTWCRKVTNPDLHPFGTEEANYSNPNKKNQSKTCSLKQEIRSLLHNSTLRHLPYPQALSMPNFRPLSPMTKSQSDNYTNPNQKIISKTCSLKQEIRSLLHNSTLGNLPYPQALSMPKFGPLNPTAKSQSDNYTNHNMKNQSKTCSPKQESRSLLHKSTKTFTRVMQKK